MLYTPMDASTKPNGLFITSNYFATFGVHPVLWHNLSAEDDARTATAIFTIFNSVVLKPLPVPSPASLVSIGRTTRRSP